MPTSSTRTERHCYQLQLVHSDRDLDLSVTLTCLPGFRFSNGLSSKQLTCSPDSSWSVPEPCKRKQRCLLTRAYCCEPEISDYLSELGNLSYVKYINNCSITGYQPNIRIYTVFRKNNHLHFQL